MLKLTTALLGTTLAVGLALAAGSAYAADLMAPPPSAPDVVTTSGGGYVSVFGGYGFATSVGAYSTATSTNVTVPFSAGYVVGAAVGANLGSNLRGEVELSYSSHDATGTAFASGAGTGTATGSVGTLYLMGNLWLDLDTGSGITPYIGGGLGVADVMPNLTLDSTGTYNTNALAFAGQIGAGVKFALTDNMSVDLGYRAKEVFNASLTGSGGASNLTNVSYLDQSVQVGLNIGF